VTRGENTGTADKIRRLRDPALLRRVKLKKKRILIRIWEYVNAALGSGGPVKKTAFWRRRCAIIGLSAKSRAIWISQAVEKERRRAEVKANGLQEKNLRQIRPRSTKGVSEPPAASRRRTQKQKKNPLFRPNNNEGKKSLKQQLLLLGIKRGQDG